MRFGIGREEAEAWEETEAARHAVKRSTCLRTLLLLNRIKPRCFLFCSMLSLKIHQQSYWFACCKRQGGIWMQQQTQLNLQLCMEEGLIRSMHSSHTYAKKFSVGFKKNACVSKLKIVCSLLRSSSISFWLVERWIHWTWWAKTLIYISDNLVGASTGWLIIHPEVEGCVFGNLVVVSGEHPRTHFYQAFLRLAKIHLAAAEACTLFPSCSWSFPGDQRHWIHRWLYGKCGEKCSHRCIRPKPWGVGLMVMPGFVTGDNVIQTM